MGMFDYVKCEYPLPHGQDREYQTKDTHCIMGTVTITKDGDFLLYGERLEKTGEFYFYDYDETENPAWVEWKVSFKDGKVVSVEEIADAR